MQKKEELFVWLRANPYLCSVNTEIKKKYHLVVAVNRPKSMLLDKQLAGNGWLREYLNSKPFGS